MFRVASLGLLVAAWFVGSMIAGEQMLPSPTTVLSTILAEAKSGELFFQLGVTLARVLVAFTLAMTIGSAIGLWMGRVALANQLGDSWLVILLNLPALVIIVLAYLWGGLTELAAILAVASFALLSLNTKASRESASGTAWIDELLLGRSGMGWGAVQVEPSSVEVER